MNSETLDTFIILSELRSYTQTANMLYVTQSTVTTRIANLEEDLGVRLFIRNRSGLLLTEEGTVFYEYAKKVLEQEREIRKDLKSIKERRKLLRIGTPTTVFDGILVPLLTEFAKNNPTYRYKIMLENSPQLFAKLQDGSLDIIYTTMPFEKKGFTCRLFVENPICIVAAPNINQYKNGITAHELLNVNTIFTDYALSSTNQFMLEIFPQWHDFYIEICDGPKALALALHGFGYAMLPRSLVMPHVRNGELEMISPLDFSFPSYQCFAVYRDTFKNPFRVLQENIPF